ncbi:hypothetical protein N4T21_15765 (plasmid) [Lacticaseibacillus paracasei]|uniref:CopG family transcriptional regulator n=1 Tax=Lacticaseibacillus paracasei TaxID=1597 RepID=A0ABD7BXU6_LACPA|nr:hypothetical protein [Lacticaseibacillus paracasei]OSP84807.1 hypothetical protein B9J76_06360 [Lacticaseibacillus paracasei]QOP57246.1 hypothetical protein HCJ88_15835 [Lacticaseibacillus paracasei]UWP78194.1 hypothetical protein KZR06_15305 [Lacticaseibacillus paracasei]UWY26208.1 hypothetical protein N4T21_15765 [Lacticaseibacillus paracasei]
MVVNKHNRRYQITITPEERIQLQFLCEATGERPSELLRRLIVAEAELIKAGFIPATNIPRKKMT